MWREERTERLFWGWFFFFLCCFCGGREKIKEELEGKGDRNQPPEDKRFLLLPFLLAAGHSVAPFLVPSLLFVDRSVCCPPLLGLGVGEERSGRDTARHLVGCA